MTLCFKCGTRINVDLPYWQGYADGKKVCYCEKCARTMVDDKTAGGLIWTVGEPKEYIDSAN